MSQKIEISDVVTSAMAVSLRADLARAIHLTNQEMLRIRGIANRVPAVSQGLSLYMDQGSIVASFAAENFRLFYRSCVVVGRRGDVSSDCLCPQANVYQREGRCEHTAVLSLLLLAELDSHADEPAQDSAEKYLLEVARAYLPAAKKRRERADSEFAKKIVANAPAAHSKASLTIGRRLDVLHDAIQRVSSWKPTDFSTDSFKVSTASRDLCSAIWPEKYFMINLDRLFRWAPSLPTSQKETWSHFVYQAKKQNLPLPDYLVELADLDFATEIERAATLAEEIARWQKRIEGERNERWSVAQPDVRQVRLMLSGSKLVWTSRIRDSHAFGPLKKESLEVFLGRSDKQAEIGRIGAMDGDSASLISVLRAQMEGKEATTSYTTWSEGMMQFVATALRHKEASRTIYPKGQNVPFEKDGRRLRRKLIKAGEDYCLVLELEDGTPLPQRLLQLASTPPTYLDIISGVWFEGDKAPEPAGVEYAVSTIPREVVESDAFERFATETGLALPDRPRRSVSALRPSVVLDLSTKEVVKDSYLLKAILTAQSPNGETLEELLGSGWSSVKEPPPGTVVLRSVLREAEDDFLALGLIFNEFSKSWEIGVGDYSSMIESVAQIAQLSSKKFVVRLSKDLVGLDKPAHRAKRKIRLVAESEKQDWFNLDLQLDHTTDELTPREIEILEAAKGGWVKLPKRGWSRLNVETDSSVKAFLDHVGFSESEIASAEGQRIKVHALQLRAQEVLNEIPLDVRRSIEARINSLHIPEDAVPDGTLNAELRAYQLDGLKFLAFLSANGLGGVLADEQGLGKTIQALAWLLWLAKRKISAGNGSIRALIVCPKSVVGNWCSETQRFAPSLTAAALNGREAQDLGTNLVVTNYHQVRINAELLGQEAWDAVILDEGQNIKNPTTGMAKAAYSLKAANRLVLTGTPVENRLMDLWSIMRFAQPTVLGGHASFAKVVKEEAGKENNLVRRRVRHFMLRRTKKQVAPDLPERIEKEIVCELTPAQQEIYDAHFKEARLMLKGVKTERDFNEHRLNILAQITKLRRVCCHPGLLNGGEPGYESGEEMSGKFGAIKDLLDPILSEGEKVLIFSQFLGVLGMLEGHFNASGVRHLKLTGKAKQQERSDMISKFQDDENVLAFLLSLKAGGTGINLTAANYVVLFDPWWNPAPEAQAIDRAHRIGQKNTVIAYRLIAKGTIEEKIRAMQKSKKAIADSVVIDESIDTVLDLESIRELLSE